MTSMAGRRLTVVVNGAPFTVEVGDLMAWPLSVAVNGVPYRVEIEPSRVDSPAAGETDDRDSPDPPHETALDGVTVEPLPVRAPMPGLITAVRVRVGERVTAGQALCTLEAMKMRNAIRAPRSGLVADVAVEVGRTVGCGDVLVTLT